MLSHVKYRNYIFKRIEKNLNIIRHPNVKSKISLNIMCQKKYTIPFSTLFLVYTPTQYALSCKIPKFQFYASRKKSK